MKYTTRMIGIVVAFCMAIPVFAQQYKATIPYRMVKVGALCVKNRRCAF